MLTLLFALSDEEQHPKIKYIYDSFHREMLRFATARLFMSGRKSYRYDAEDAVQNAFIKIVHAIDEIDVTVSKKSLRSYVFSILTNEIFNILREKNNFSEISEEFEDENSYNFIEELQIKDNYDRVVKAISRLDEIYSVTLSLIYVEEMTVSEAAAFMGVPEKTVYTRLERGRRRLLEIMKEDGYDVNTMRP